MTALLGVFGPGAQGVRARLPSLLRAMARSGDEVCVDWHGPDALIAAVSHSWEASLSGWTGPVVHDATDLVIAADANLYYVRDLRRRLSRAGTATRALGSAELIAEAVRTWGDRIGEYLEGDWAIMVWDKARRRLLVTRDLTGRRGLYRARLDNATTVVGSSPRAILAAGVRDTYDVELIACVAAGLPANSDRTAFADIRLVPAGATHAGAPDRVRPVAQLAPPAFSDAWRDEPPSRDDVEELRHLLTDAVVERLPSAGTAAVWMSGGWDSTSVFASGRDAIERRSLPVELRPVSLQYPPDDSGNEDRYVLAISRRWRTDVAWVPVDQVPVFGDPETQVRLQDDVLAHPFQAAQRALAAASRSLGARVALDGLGGDTLFMSSDAVLSDHLLRGRVDLLAQGWRRRRDRSPRSFVATVIHPLLSYELVDWLRLFAGDRLRGRLEFAWPSWIIPWNGIVSAARPAGRRESNEAVTAWEARFLLTNQYFTRLHCCGQSFSADGGTQVRSPLTDGRLLAFAARRPLDERQNMGETKILLRRAMQGLLPEEVLTRRLQKTGTTTDYVKRQVRRELDTVAVSFGPSGHMLLEDMGVIDRQKLLVEVERFRSGVAPEAASPLLSTVLAERWLAARERAR